MPATVLLLAQLLEAMKGPRDALTFSDTICGFCSLLPLIPRSDPLRREWDSPSALLPWAVCHLADVLRGPAIFAWSSFTMTALAPTFSSSLVSAGAVVHTATLLPSATYTGLGLRRWPFGSLCPSTLSASVMLMVVPLKRLDALFHPLQPIWLQSFGRL